MTAGSSPKQRLARILRDIRSASKEGPRDGYTSIHLDPDDAQYLLDSLTSHEQGTPMEKAFGLVAPTRGRQSGRSLHFESMVKVADLVDGKTKPNWKTIAREIGWKGQPNSLAVSFKRYATSEVSRLTARQIAESLERDKKR